MEKKSQFKAVYAQQRFMMSLKVIPTCPSMFVDIFTQKQSRNTVLYQTLRSFKLTGLCYKK